MLAKRLDTGRVLQFVQADNVSIETGKRREKFVALAGEFVNLVAIPTAAFHVVERTALVIKRAGRVICRDEEVERIHRGNTDRSADRFGRNGAGIRSRVIRRSGWDDAVEAEVITKHTNRVL